MLWRQTLGKAAVWGPEARVSDSGWDIRRVAVDLGAARRWTSPGQRGDRVAGEAWGARLGTSVIAGEPRVARATLGAGSCGWGRSPRRGPIQVPRACDCGSSQGKRIIAVVIESKALRWGGHPGGPCVIDHRALRWGGSIIVTRRCDRGSRSLERCGLVKRKIAVLWFLVVFQFM